MQPLLDEQEIQRSQCIPPRASTLSSLRIYTTTQFVRENLSLPGITFVDVKEDADLIWASQDISADGFAVLKPSQFINQIPREECLTYKHRLAKLLWMAYGAQTEWFPRTYDLQTQLTEFVADYLQTQQENAASNIWIVKPWCFRCFDINSP